MKPRQATQKEINLTDLRLCDLSIPVPNHRAICRLLGEPFPNGNRQKMLQEKNWARFFESEKVEGSNKIIITEIYQKAKPIEPSKYKNIYLEDLVLILVTHCACRQRFYALGATKFYYNNSDLLKIVGFCNGNYSKFKYKQDDLYYKISGETKKVSTNAFQTDFKMLISTLTNKIESFFLESGSKGLGALRRANKDIHRRGLLDVEETYQATHESDGFITDISPEQKTAFTKIYSDTLLKFDCKSTGEIHYRKQQKAFYQQIHRQFNMLGFTSHKKVTKYSFTQDQAATIKSYRSESNITKAKQSKLNVSSNFIGSITKDKLESRDQLITLLIAIDEEEQNKWFKVL